MNPKSLIPLIICAFLVGCTLRPANTDDVQESTTTVPTLILSEDILDLAAKSNHDIIKGAWQANILQVNCFESDQPIAEELTFARLDAFSKTFMPEETSEDFINFQKQLKKYDADFFENNRLFAVFLSSKNSATSFSVNDVTYMYGILQIFVQEQLALESANSASNTGYWCAFVETAVPLPENIEIIVM